MRNWSNSQVWLQINGIPHSEWIRNVSKKHENGILDELYQVKSNMEVLREFVKTPSDRFCRFAAQILTDSEVIDIVGRVLESKFDYGLSETDVANNRLIASVVPHAVEL
eukprot:1124877_1